MKINWVVVFCVLAFVFFEEGALGGVKQKQLKFEWDYEQPPEDVAGFRLYGSDVSGGPYELVAEIPMDEVSGDFVSTKNVEAEDNATSIKYFVLTAYDLENNESGYSNEVFAIIDFEAPVGPYNLTVIVVPVTK